MLSLIIGVFGRLFTTLKNWVAPHGKAALITFLIILANIWVYIKGYDWPLQLGDIKANPIRLLGYQFTHMGPMHLLWNMLLLAFVGPSVEYYFGRLKFLLVYLICGVCSGIGFLLLFPEGFLVGASGAIAGLMAIYPFIQESLLSCFTSGILLFYYFHFNFMEFCKQLQGTVDNVAFLGHIAGGVTGLILFCAYNRKKLSNG